MDNIDIDQKDPLPMSLFTVRDTDLAVKLNILLPPTHPQPFAIHASGLDLEQKHMKIKTFYPGFYSQCQILSSHIIFTLINSEYRQTNELLPLTATFHHFI